MPQPRQFFTAHSTRWWPRPCALCQTWCTAGLCPSCLQQFATPTHRCACCGLTLPHIDATAAPDLWPHPRPAPLDACLCAVDYAYPWQYLLMSYKFQAELHLRHLLTDLLKGTLMAAAPIWASLGGVPDVLVPMPLSRQRWQQRGFHQTALLAQALAPYLPFPCHTGLLRRVIHRQPQMNLGLEERRHNIRGVFALAPTGLGPWTGRHVLLLDDVATTLSTAKEAAAVLKAGGAQRVTLLTVARTP